MMKKDLWAIGLLALFTLSGCTGQDTSFQADTFSDQDKCIVSIQSSKTMCYGDSREEVEAIIQEDGDSSYPIVRYDSGVRVAYRDNIAVGFHLIEGSEELYQTARGARAGMSKTEMIELYGRQYGYQATENNLDYAYDMAAEQFVEKSKVLSFEVQEKREQIFLISANFNFGGNEKKESSQILLADLKMAIFLE